MQANTPENVTLIVEDDRLSREGLRQLLAIFGFSTQTARTLGEGLAKLQSRPSQIVLDLMLPDGSGVELLRRVREQRLPVRVVVTTSASDPELLAEVEDYHPEVLIRKPLDARALMDQLGRPPGS